MRSGKFFHGQSEKKPHPFKIDPFLYKYFEQQILISKVLESKSTSKQQWIIDAIEKKLSEEPIANVNKRKSLTLSLNPILRNRIEDYV